MCLTCGNKDKLICSHVAKDTCTECERDDNAVVLDGICFFCLCEGKVSDSYSYKGAIQRSLEAIRLGKKRKKLGLPPPPVSSNCFYEIFMEGYDCK